MHPLTSEAGVCSQRAESPEDWPRRWITQINASISQLQAHLSTTEAWLGICARDARSLSKIHIGSIKDLSGVMFRVTPLYQTGAAPGPQGAGSAVSDTQTSVVLAK